MMSYTKGNLVRPATLQPISTQYTTQQTGRGGNGMKVVLTVTAVAGGTLTATIEEYNPVSGGWRPLLVSAGLAAAGDTVLRINPNSAAVANQIAQEVAPKRWRVKGVVTGGSVTWGAYATYGA